MVYDLTTLMAFALMQNYLPLIHLTFKAYLPGFSMLRILAIWDESASFIITSPDQLGLKSFDLQLGHIRPVVKVLHFLQAISLTNCLTFLSFQLQ